MGKNYSFTFCMCSVCYYVFLLLNTAFAQQLRFQQLQSNHALDNQSILTIDQDRYRRLWFGGKDKLYVYDSRNIKDIFENDSIFINGEYLNKIAIDQHNNIFLGTAYGLLVYSIDQQKYIVSNKKRLINGQIKDVKTWRDKTLAASSHGLYVIGFDVHKKTYLIEEQLSELNIQTLDFKDDNTIIFSSGLKLFEKRLQQDAPTNESEITLPVQHDFITSICIANNELWIGTNNNGIFIYRQSKLVKSINESNSILLSNNIRKIKEIEGEVLIGTLKGLTSIDKNGTLTNSTHEINVPWSISQNSIYDIYRDDQNILWVGTYFGGLNAVYPNAIPLQTLTSKPTSRYRLDSEIVSSIAEDKDIFYIGTEETGLQAINKKTGLSKNIPISSNLIKHLLISDDKLYIAQHNGGLSILDIKTNRLRNHVFISNQNPKAQNINKILVDINKVIFLATDFGIFQFDEDTGGHFYEEMKGAAVNQIIDNLSDGIFAVGYSKLWYKSYHKEKFEVVNSVGINSPIRNLSIDENRDIWVSTDHQIYLLNNQSLSLVYENKDLVFGNFINLNNHLWICSNNGLLRYNLNTKRLHILTTEDGLTTNFLQNSKLYVNQNEFFVTSLKGINIFNPQELKFNNQAPSVLLSTFSILDKEILLKRTNGGKDTSYNITLPYNQNYFSVEFASTNFIKPQKNKYKYKLEGFDKDWKQTNYPIARYMNIAPGVYTLSMMASNNDGVWAETPLSVNIHITPPFWKTWWAYVLYVLFTLALLHFIIRFIVERQLLLNTEKEHEKKIKFFTQISHEIRTPLTLITVPIEDIIQATQDLPSVQSKAKRLQKNANKLLGIVNELLDFKKIDDGKEKLTLSSVRIKPYLEEFFYLFSDIAVIKHLHFYIRYIEDVGMIQLDAKQFDKALFNLLSNAVKYSHDGGTVFLEAMVVNNDYIIQIADNGIGVSENNQFRIFEEYYRDPKAEDIVGTGIGLALTKRIIEQHKGVIDCTTEEIEDQQFTVFKIKIPLKYLTRNRSTAPESPEPQTVISKTTTTLLGKETLLLVEDNRELSEATANLFKDHYNVLTAYDGEEGLQYALKYLPDIIISDVMMPKMNGIDMCEKIKSNVLTAHIPLILLTADTNESSHISGLEFGANVYLHKPFHTHVLLLTVKNLLDLASDKRRKFDIQAPSLHSEIDYTFLIKIEEIIDQHLLNPTFSVDFLSKEMGMSPPILYKKLKAITNLSVNNFIKQYRFKKAIDLLRSEKNISEVAYAVGFSDRKYFSREFKKNFGVNPSEFVGKLDSE